MKRMFLTLSLAALTVAASTSDASAQYYGGWGRGGLLSSIFGGGVYSPYYQNYGNAYGYGPDYYNSVPNYSTVPSTYYDSPLQTRISNYPPAISPQAVAITVHVPFADAQVWFDGASTSQQGMERIFHSPALESNHNYVYHIKARWMENGRPVNQEREVTVQAGRNVVVNFRVNPGESVPAPLPKATPRD